MPLNEEQIEIEISKYEPFREETENHKLHTREFLKQLIQHNIRGMLLKMTNLYHSDREILQ